MAVLSSFTTNTSAADAMDTLNKMLADIKALKEAAIPAPSFTAQPSISGTPTVGQTLTGNPGTISNGSVSARQWLRDGVAISDATAATYTLVTADAGKVVTFRVTATGGGGSTDATSQAATVAAAPVLNALSLSNTAAQVGAASTITINGATSGTTITGTPPDGMTLNSSARTISGTPTTAGTYTFDLTEAGAGASNSPRKSSVTITVAAAPAAAPFFGSSTQSFGDDTTATFGKAA